MKIDQEVNKYSLTLNVRNFNNSYNNIKINNIQSGADMDGSGNVSMNPQGLSQHPQPKRTGSAFGAGPSN